MSFTSIFIALVLLAANAFFVAAEFAIIAARSSKLEARAETGTKSARFAIDAVQSLQLQLAGAQLGITMASLGLGRVAEPAIAHALEDQLDALGIFSHSVVTTIGLLVALTIVTFFHMVFGEMVPKNIAITAPETTLLALALPYRLYMLVFKPFVVFLNTIGSIGARMLGVEPRDEIESAHTADDIASMLNRSHDAGLIEEFEHELLTGALNFDEERSAAVMVPREQVDWVDRSQTLAEVESVIVETGHTRLIVADGDLDNLVGFVHAKDLLQLPGSAQHEPLPEETVRPLVRVTSDVSLENVLLRMQRERIHVAVVQARNRTTAGVLTLEDVVEELVGEIRDESDRDLGAPHDRDAAR